MSYSAVVRIYATTQSPDYDAPWQMETPSRGTGSGVVVGPGRVLTGAHVLANSTFVQVQKVADPNKYIAVVEGVCHDADLALVRVDDPKFMEGVTPETIGALPSLRDRVAVAGFPIGGDEISITEGVVSRIEVQRYSHSQRALLAVTVDAAINPGNSGGPVYLDGELVGIAFQSLGEGENIGEMVPAPRIKWFLDGLEGGRSHHVPDFGFTVQNLENPALRRTLGMAEGESGVRVRRTFMGGTADGVLEVGDVILALGGYPVANNGTVRFRERFRMGLEVVLGPHYVGEAIEVTFLRGGHRQTRSMTLRRTPRLVPWLAYDTRPRWFVHAGLVFQVLTVEYLRTWDQWWNRAPKEFLAHYYFGRRSDARRELVILTKILADEINVGYEPFHDETVLTINGHTPVDLDDLIARVDACDGQLELEMSQSGLIVIDASEAGRVNHRILERYGVPGDRGGDGGGEAAAQGGAQERAASRDGA
ncbi:MAG: trypsin-like peptidase domain-containing protein [Myxococcales bacterium]|nr:trypsin-like peptidase domain-containing protein [Myxococcales bacterium]MCB9751213.1 trypsin-like peptidase domain-containing protein [Myxococcales bacterium]